MRLAFPPDVDAAGLHVTVHDTGPIPADRSAWRRTRTGTDAGVAATTASGWPLYLVECADAVWGFYELFDRAVVTEVRGDRARARAYILAGDLDRTPREVVALAQLWDPP